MLSNSLIILSYAARRELIERVAPLYREASLAQKGLVLDRMVAMTGYARKYAIHLLNHAPAGKRTIHRHRQPRYGSQVQHALIEVWKAAKYICAKRLIPFLPTLVAALERHEYLHLSEEKRRLLLAISTTTAERLLRPHRPSGSRGLCTTQAGPPLKHQIPIRTFHGWDNAQSNERMVDDEDASPSTILTLSIPYFLCSCIITSGLSTPEERALVGVTSQSSLGQV